MRKWSFHEKPRKPKKLPLLTTFALVVGASLWEISHAPDVEKNPHHPGITMLNAWSKNLESLVDRHHGNVIAYWEDKHNDKRPRPKTRDNLILPPSQDDTTQVTQANAPQTQMQPDRS
ncbi:MAG: hypothetical protein KDI46_06765 [Alphaproteobacteria bacterium]|nr:hypothetical protein [Alphaproteobacteria bacterium]